MQVLCDSRRAAGLRSLVIIADHKHPEKYAHLLAPGAFSDVPDSSTIIAALPLLPNMESLTIWGESDDQLSTEVRAHAGLVAWMGQLVHSLV